MADMGRWDDEMKAANRMMYLLYDPRSEYSLLCLYFPAPIPSMMHEVLEMNPEREVAPSMAWIEP